VLEAVMAEDQVETGVRKRKSSTIRPNREEGGCPAQDFMTFIDADDDATKLRVIETTGSAAKIKYSPRRSGLGQPIQQCLHPRCVS
jgi:hypothetical protein